MNRNQSIIVKSVTVTCLLIFLTGSVIYYLGIRSKADHAQMLIQSLYFDAKVAYVPHTDKIDSMVSREVVADVSTVTVMLDSLGSKYSRHSIDHVTSQSGLTATHSVKITERDQQLITSILKRYCDDFDILLSLQYVKLYNDSIQINFDNTRIALAGMKQVVPHRDVIHLYDDYDLNSLNGDEWLLIISELKFRHSDLVQAFKRDLKPIKEKICNDIYKKYLIDEA